MNQYLITTFNHRDTVLNVNITPDDKHILTSSYNGTMKIWGLK